MIICARSLIKNDRNYTENDEAQIIPNFIHSKLSKEKDVTANFYNNIKTKLNLFS